MKKGKKKKYCKLYLERWNSLLETLAGIKLPVFSSTEAAKLGAEFLKYSNLWDEWQSPRYKETRENWKFKDRKHIPNINFIICQLNQKLGMKHHNRCFPLPGKSSLMKLKTYFDEMKNAIEQTKQATPTKQLKQKSITQFLKTNVAVPSAETTPQEDANIKYLEQLWNDDDGLLHSEVHQLHGFSEGVAALLRELSPAENTVSESPDMSPEWFQMLGGELPSDNAVLFQGYPDFENTTPQCQADFGQFCLQIQPEYLEGVFA